MDGLLVIDKPAGPTSHDVVARARRLLREKRVGHTGTLDPLATGVLPLVVGRATRLARFLSASDKAYEAVIVLGFATDTGDATGTPLTGDRPPSAEACPRVSPETLERALDAFRGTFLQQPPVYSAKKIGGVRSYTRAREGRLGSDPLMVSPFDSLVLSPSPLDVARGDPAALEGSKDEPAQGRLSNHEPPVRPQPTTVTTHRLELVQVDDNRVTVRVDCSAGFYVRSLAHDLGERLGTGAHLGELRRTRSGDYALAEAMALDHAERDPAAAASRLIPLSGMLQRLPAIALTADDVRRARNGQDVGPGLGTRDSGFESRTATPESRPFVRLMDAGGDLIGIAEPADRPGLLHPFVVLG